MMPLGLQQNQEMCMNIPKVLKKVSSKDSKENSMHSEG